MKRLLALALCLALAEVGHAQVTTSICQGQICVTLPAASVPVPPAVTNTPPVQPLQPNTMPAPAVQPKRTSHAPVIASVVISAAVTLVLVKLFKRSKSK